MAYWTIKSRKNDFDSVAKQCAVSNITARLLCNRFLNEAEEIRHFLNPALTDLYSPFLMKGMKEACAVLSEAIREQIPIRIIGDYDVDGVVATYILYDMLREKKAVVDYIIPERVNDGYGMNRRMVEQAKQAGIGLLLTCDNGISAWEEIAYAYQLGMRVIVTDHHEIPEIVPKAEAVLNAKLPDSGYPYRELCGSGVALKLAEALSLAEGEEASGTMKKYLELAAIATVCDVVELTGENRVIVKKGLEQLCETKNVGILALMQANKLEASKMNSYQLGFVIGPCINAGGRLETAALGVELLLETSPERAQKQAEYLLALNAERKQMTQDAVKEAETVLTEQALQKDAVLVLYLKQCHESIAGIVAGRIREKYYRPTIVLTDGKDIVKGSARSIEGYHIAEELKKCSSLLQSFGGHPMAAGLSLQKEKIEVLRSRLNANVELTAQQLEKKVSLDMVLPFQYATEALYREISCLEPFGCGNPKPLFGGRNIQAVGAKYIGREKKYLKFCLRDESGTECEALYFGDAAQMEQALIQGFGQAEVDRLFQKKENNIRLSIAFELDLADYMSNIKISLLIREYQLSIS